MCHSKKAKYHDAHADFLTAIFNYCRQNEALKELINLDAAWFEKKYFRKSPAPLAQSVPILLGQSLRLV